MFVRALAQSWFSVAMTLLFAWAIFVGGGFYGIYDVQLRIASLVIAALGLLSWLVWAFRHNDWAPRSALAPALLLPLASFAVSLVLSDAPRFGIEYLAWAVILCALYLLLVRVVADPRSRQLVGTLSVTLFMIVAVLYLVVVGDHWIEFWRLVGRITTPPLRPLAEGLTFGNPSAVMTVSTLLLAPSAAHLGIGTTRRRLVVGTLVALDLAVATVSGSRSGWFALGVGGIATVGVWLARSRIGPEPRRLPRPRPRSLLLAAGIATLTTVIVVTLAPSILDRALSGGEQLRAGFWLVAARMFASSPVVGVGPGMWVARRISYTSPPETDYYIPYAHDVYVQTAAEFGIVGILAGLFAIVLVGRLILDGLRSPQPGRRRMGWAALFAITYFGAHQLLDFYANMPAALLAFAIPVAMLDATAVSEPLDRPRRGWMPSPRFIWRGWLTATVAAALVLGWTEASALALHNATEALAAHQDEAAAEAARIAVAIDPAMPANQFTLGLADASIGNDPGAAKAFQAAASADDLPASWIDLAAVEVGLGQASGATSALGRAIRLGSQQPAILVAAAKVAADAGRPSEAVTYLTEAITLVPTLAGDAYWTSDPAIAHLWPSLLNRLASTDPGLGVAIAMAMDDRGEESRLANEIADATARRRTRITLDAWNGDRALYRQAVMAAEADPLNVASVAWAARLALRYHDDKNAARFQRWSDLLGGYGSGGYEVHVGQGTSVGPIAGLTGVFYGQYTYRRPTPPDQLVPTVPHLFYEPPPPIH